MTKTIKRKVRRRRPESMRQLGGGIWAPVIGEFSEKLYHFVPLDIGEPLPFPSLERTIFLRTFGR